MVEEPEFSDEEVVEEEFEAWGDVLIFFLFILEVDAEADGWGVGSMGAFIGGFHDAWTAAGAEDVFIFTFFKFGFGPLGEFEG